MIPSIAIADELLTESEAVRRVHGRSSEVRGWLRTSVPVRRGPTGVRLYRWSEVLAAIPMWEEVPEVQAPRATLRRTSRW